jgi:hypothetical protein
MGFFDKVKQSMNIGGVKVQVQAPASAQLTDASIQVTVTLTNGEKPATVKSVTVAIREDLTNHQPPAPTPYKDLTSVSNNESFSLQPNETKAIQFTVPLNSSAYADENMPQGTAMATAANIFGKLQEVSEAIDTVAHTYYVEASADVEGAAIDPSHRSYIQLLRYNQMGGGFNIHT